MGFQRLFYERETDPIAPNTTLYYYYTGAGGGDQLAERDNRHESVNTIIITHE